jgi:hypothetical protein
MNTDQPPSLPQSVSRFAAVKELADRRPKPETTIDRATIEDMMHELSARIGPSHEATEGLWILQASGVPPEAKLMRGQHGSVSLLILALADALAALPKHLRQAVDECESDMRRPKIIQDLRDQRQARKSAELAKRHPGIVKP